MIVRRTVRWVDAHSGQAPLLKKALRYVFPDHWSFMLGEIALYCFLVLVATGIYITFFFVPSYSTVVYDGAYKPLQGQEVTLAYKSVVDLSFEVRAGLLIRQTHHWAAVVFVAAIVFHLFRVFFTGAFRKPRRPTYYVGLLMLMLAIPEGYLGYSLVDDLLSGMGLAIGYALALSIPFVGANLATLLWQGEYPGTTLWESRMYILHVFVVPTLIAVLIAVHLALVVFRHHTQFRGGKRRETNVVGTPMWPGYALRSLGLMLGVVAVLFLLGGLVQINPIWLWGPYHTYLSMNGAQPDWYAGWMIGALRLMPSWEPTIGDYTLIPNPFFGGVLFPLLVAGFLFAWPAIERRVTGDDGFHHLLDRPRDAAWRTGVGVWFFSFVGIVFVAGAADRIFVQLRIPYQPQVWVMEAVVWVLPPLLGYLSYRWCRALAATELHPLRGWTGTRLRRNERGGFDVVGGSRVRPDDEPEPEQRLLAE